MKRLLFAAILIFASIAAFSQDDEYQKFLEQRKKQMQEKSEANKQKISDMSQEYKDYVDRMNAEFADFVAKQWELFDEFKKQQLSYSQPKIEEAPVAVNTVEEQDVVTEESKEIKYVEEAELPAVTEAVKVAYEGKDNDNYELKTRLDKNGAVDLPVKEYVEEKPAPITYGTEIK